MARAFLVLAFSLAAALPTAAQRAWATFGDSRRADPMKESA